MRALPKGLRVFALVSLGQFVSVAGSILSGFALGVWTYQLTGEVTAYALIMVFGALPGLLISPVAGVVLDRFDRRKLIVLSEIGMSLVSLVLAALLWQGRLSLWQIYLGSAVNAIFLSFVQPAYAAIVPQLVDKEHLGQANGMSQAANAGGQIIAPALAGVLVTLIGIQGVLVIDFLSFFFPIAIMMAIRIPRLERPPHAVSTSSSFWRELWEGARYIFERPGLVGMLGLFASTVFLSHVVVTLFTPFVLAFASAADLGVLLSVSGAGMLLGSLAMGIWGGPRRRIAGVLGFTLLSGLSLILGGLRPSLILVGIAGFVFYLSFPIIGGCAQVIWQRKVALDVQGRVFALTGMVPALARPLSALLAGPLADKFFEPLLMPAGALAQSVGRIIGVGPGRGMGLLFILMGGLTLATVIAGYVFRPVRLIETELPDAIPDAPPQDDEAAPVGGAEPLLEKI
ncbi:MAG: MFS transporter [Chloroflexota bacterium]